jgi:adenosylcobinamide-GDP ribazoletransferase
LRFSTGVDPRGFLAAAQFLTRFPVPRTECGLEAAVVWMPLVGLVLGGVLALVDLGLRWLSVGSLLSSTILVVLLLVFTGALHADGLMDTSDAVFGHASPEQRLEIMRDPRSGTFGVVGFVCVFALKVASVGSLGPGLILLAPVLGRWAIVLVACVFPYGRASGLGSPLKAAATPRALALASAVPLIVCLGLGWGGILGGALAALSALGLGRWLVSLLPGLTGDCYGAICEVVETVVWVSGAVVALGT